MFQPQVFLNFNSTSDEHSFTIFTKLRFNCNIIDIFNHAGQIIILYSVYLVLHDSYSCDAIDLHGIDYQIISIIFR